MAIDGNGRVLTEENCVARMVKQKAAYRRLVT